MQANKFRIMQEVYKVKTFGTTHDAPFYYRMIGGYVCLYQHDVMLESR